MNKREIVKNDFDDFISSSMITENKIIELGCNNYERRLSNNIIGIDVFVQHKPRIVCDIDKGLSIKTNSVEMVCGVDIVEHLDLLKLLDECYRVLQPSGFLYFVIPNADVHGYEIKNKKQYGHKNNWNADDFKKIILKNKLFDIVLLNKAYCNRWFFLFIGEKNESSEMDKKKV